MDGIIQLLKSELMVFIMAATPIIELRGSLPYGIMVLNMGYMHAFIISVLGSILPSPFILWLLPRVMEFLKDKKGIGKFVQWFSERTRRKSEKVERYSLLGLFLLVAVPLPGTGVWTGSAVAALLRLPFKISLFICFLGTITAGLLMLTLSHVGVQVF